MTAPPRTRQGRLQAFVAKEHTLLVTQMATMSGVTYELRNQTCIAKKQSS